MNTHEQDKPARLSKGQAIQHWRSLARNQTIRPAAVPYRHFGSTYDQDGIRVTGSREFVDAVLSRFTDLLDYENGQTRLQLVYGESTDKTTRRPTGQYCAYVQVHERGPQARMMGTNIYETAARGGAK